MGCPEVAHIAVRLQEHFMYPHFQSQVAVIQEGKETLPHCNLRIIQMSVGRLIKHQHTVQLDKNTHMRWQRRDILIAEKCTGRSSVSRGRTEQSAFMEWIISNIWEGYCTERKRTGRCFSGTFEGQDKFGGR